MNREERREKRRKDTRSAALMLVIFFLIIVMIAAGAGVALNKFVFQALKGDGGKKPIPETETQTQTEETAATEEMPEEPAVDPTVAQAQQFVAGMTLEDKIAQMFVITPNALTGFPGVTAAGDTTKEAYSKHPVGGLIYMSENLKDKEQTATMLANMQTIAKERTQIPVFLCVDEEGGSVARIAANSAFGVTDVGNMSAIGATGDSQNAYNAGAVIGAYLAELGFNVDFAPVADVLTNTDNSAIGDRSFGSDPAVVAEMVNSEMQGLLSQGIYGTAKHFPGHGGVAGDSHDGGVSTERTLEEMMAAELVPFQKAIDNGAAFVMVGHIAAPNVTGETTPASLSKVMITDVLRGQMGYNGIVITDAMNMKAITDSYNSDRAAVLAVNAGVDMILMPANYQTAYDGLLAAVNDGTVSQERIDEAVTRIIRVKLQMGQ